MDDDLRDLERRAATDPAARVTLENEWGRRGLGWLGERLPPDLTRGVAAPFYLFRRRFPALWRNGKLAGYLRTIPPPSPDDRGPFLPVAELADLETMGIWTFVLDISRSVPLFSMDLARLVSLHAETRRKDGRVILVNVQKSQRAVIDLIGLAATLTIAESLEHAAVLLGG